MTLISTKQLTVKTLFIMFLIIDNQMLAKLLFLSFIAVGSLAASSALPFQAAGKSVRTLTDTFLNRIDDANLSSTTNSDKWCSIQSATVPQEETVLSLSISSFLSVFNLDDTKTNMSNRLPFLNATAHLNMTDLFQAFTNSNSLMTVWIIFIILSLAGFVGLFWLGACAVNPNLQCCEKIRSRYIHRIQPSRRVWITLLLTFCTLIPTVALVFKGFSIIAKLEPAVDSTKCAVALFLSRFLHGGQSSGREVYFFGLYDYKNNIDGMAKLKADGLIMLEGLLPGIESSLVNAQSALNELESMGDPTTLNGSFTQYYTQPTAFSAAGSQVESSLGPLLGNPTIPNSLVGTLYSKLSQLASALSALSQQIHKSRENAADFQMQLQFTLTRAQQTIDRTLNMNEQLPPIFDKIEPYTSTLNEWVRMYYLVLAIFSIIGFVTALLAVCLISEHCSCLRSTFTNTCPLSSISKCTTVLFSVTTLLSFLAGVALFLSLTVLVLSQYQSCSLFTDSLSNDAAFGGTIMHYVDMATYIGSPDLYLISYCLPRGSGINPTSTEFTAHIGMLHTIGVEVSDTRRLNLTAVTEASNKVDAAIEMVFNQSTIDIVGDADSIDWFQNVANGSWPLTCPSMQDSLVPSHSNESLAIIPCRDGVTQVECLDFSNCPSGCIDMSAVMADCADVTALRQKIMTRYSSDIPCATQLADEFAINYQNWYQPLIDNSTGVGALRERWISNPRIHIQAAVSQFKDLLPSLKNYSENVEKPLVDYYIPLGAEKPSSSCQPISIDLVQAKDGVCTSIFNVLYDTLVVVGVSLLLIILAKCCLVIAYVEEHHLQSSFEENIDSDAARNQQDRVGRIYPLDEPSELDILHQSDI